MQYTFFIYFLIKILLIKKEAYLEEIISIKYFNIQIENVYRHSGSSLLGGRELHLTVGGRWIPPTIGRRPA